MTLSQRAEHIAAAEAWRDAPSKTARNKLSKANGVRWSELLYLSYWDPTRFAIIDGMHNLFLGLVRYHFREIIGTEWKESRNEEYFRKKESTDKEISRGRQVLQGDPTNAKLQRLTIPVLRALCRENNVLGQIAVEDGKQVKKRCYIEALQVGHLLPMSFHLKLMYITVNSNTPTSETPRPTGC